MDLAELIVYGYDLGYNL